LVQPLAVALALVQEQVQVLVREPAPVPEPVLHSPRPDQPLMLLLPDNIRPSSLFASFLRLIMVP